MFAQAWKQLADPLPTFTELAKFPRRRHDFADIVELRGFQFAHRFARILPIIACE